MNVTLLDTNSGRINDPPESVQPIGQTMSQREDILFRLSQTRVNTLNLLMKDSVLFHDMLIICHKTSLFWCRSQSVVS